MIRVVIIEDEKETQLELKRILREMSVLKNEEVKIDYFTKYTKELKEIINDTTEHKIYIIDIKLESKISGIDIAKYVRELDWESEIIFITNHDKMFETTYKSVFEVFDFIIKFHDFEVTLKKDINAIFKRNFDNKMFKYNNNNFSIQVYYRSITHIIRDKESRKIIIYTDKNHYSVIMPLSEAQKFLDQRFHLVHRACVANLDRVESFQWSKGYFKLDNGKEVDYLSKKYRKEVKEYYESLD